MYKCNAISVFNIVVLNDYMPLFSVFLSNCYAFFRYSFILVR